MNKAVKITLITIALFILTTVLIWSPVEYTGKAISLCGDNKCQFPFETTANCPQDCGKIVPKGPVITRFIGRTECGDNACSPPESYDKNSPNFCEKDCVCDKNNVCEPHFNENNQNCPSDCPTPTLQPTPPLPTPIPTPPTPAPEPPTPTPPIPVYVPESTIEFIVTRVIALRTDVEKELLTPYGIFTYTVSLDASKYCNPGEILNAPIGTKLSIKIPSNEGWNFKGDFYIGITPGLTLTDNVITKIKTAAKDQLSQYCSSSTVTQPPTPLPAPPTPTQPAPVTQPPTPALRQPTTIPSGRRL
ncbi:hypothetical protein HYV79_03365 [Candidatus Woesearchaeota archaeon]|nr:hypothetical protein [Candidatus Woesearchaeota archaeon]